MANINPLEEVGIKYKKVKLNNKTYILIPSSPILGYSMGEDYLAKTKYKLPLTKDILSHEKYLIDEIINFEDLQLKYEDYDPEDAEFLVEYYFEEEKNNILIIEIRDGQIFKRKISIPRVEDLVGQEVYERQNNIPSVVLNDSALRQLLEMDDIGEMKEKLTRLKNLVASYIEEEKAHYITRLEVTNGKVTSIDTDAKVIEPRKETKKEPSTIKDHPVEGDFSVKGLERYISERVFGHDKEIRTIAKTLYMNYTAEEGEKISSLLIVGPTGTGKTETLRIASKYLSLPFKEVNTVNLVPQGIVGTSLEDCLYSLIVQAEFDESLAARGIVLLDEFDKLGNTQSDYKGDIKEILLKFVEGTEFDFEREKQSYSLDTTRITKICAGAFTRIFEKDKGIGFGSINRDYGRDIRPEEVKDRINEKGYFGIELLDRIEVPVVYHDLDMETKRRILLESKISEYLSKKKRYLRQFGVDLIAEDSYVEAIFETLKDRRESVRLLNNLVHTTLDPAEYELCTNPEVKGKRLVLSRKTVENPEDFTII